MIERHHERTDNIIQRGTLDGWDHHSRWHARVKLDVGHRGELGLVDPNKGYIIRVVGLWVSQPVGGNLDDVAMDNWDNALLVCREVNFGAHIRADVADVLNGDLSFDGK